MKIFTLQKYKKYMGDKPMKNLKLVIFDMDGLLFDTEMISYKASAQTFKNKYNIDFPLDVYKQTIGMDVKGVERFYSENYGNNISFSDFLDEYGQAFKRILDEEGLSIKSGVVELLDYLDEIGLKRCIASSSSLSTIESYLNITDLAGRFDFYLSGEEVENGKPAPDIFLEACRRANESPETAMVLEDSVNGFRAAKSANINCIIVPDLIEPTIEINQNAYEVVSNLEEVIQIIRN